MAEYQHIYHTFEPDTNMKIEVLPSTSPANAACSLEDLIEAWGILRKDELGK